MYFEMDPDLRSRFKVAVALKGETIRDALTRAVHEYVKSTDVDFKRVRHGKTREHNTSKEL